MRRTLLAVSLSFAAALAAQEAPVNAPVLEIDRLARYEVPADWSIEHRSEGVDDVLIFEESSETRISMRVFGGKGSKYATPPDFLKSPAASTMGRPPKKLGAVQTAGLSTRLYESGYPVGLGDPHVKARAPKLGREIFCLVPAGKRFFVLSFAQDRPDSDPERGAEIAWIAFLKSFALREKPRAR